MVIHNIKTSVNMCNRAKPLYLFVVVIFFLLAACSDSSTQSDPDGPDPQRPVEQPDDDPVPPGDDSVTVITFAGTGDVGRTDGPAAQAEFNWPRNLLFDDQWNLYISDSSNDVIRKINTDGEVTTFAGSGGRGHQDGPKGDAMFFQPNGLAFHQNGDLFLADRNNHRVRRISPDGEVTSYAGNGARLSIDGAAASASFELPDGLVIDSEGNVIIADMDGNRIRKITPDQQVTTIAGSGEFGFANGNGTEASFRWPTSIAIDGDGNIFISDTRNHMIRKLTPNGDVTVVAGNGERGYADGEASQAQFNDPHGLAVANDGTIYVAESLGNRIRKISTSGIVSTVAGTGEKGFKDGPADEAMFDSPVGLVINENGNLLVSDLLNNRIRKIVFE